MTNLTVFVPAGPAVVPAFRDSWTGLDYLLVGALALLLLLGTMGCWRCYFNQCSHKMDPPVWNETPESPTDSSPSSSRLDWSRLPREEIPLATFVTRRPSTWHRLQARGDDCILMVD